MIPGDADDVIPADAGAGDGDRNNKRKVALDTSLIGEAVTSVFWWCNLSMVMFAEDLMVAVRAFAMSCPCHRLTATTKYMRSSSLNLNM